MSNNLNLFSRYYKTHGMKIFLYPEVMYRWMLNKRDARNRPIFVKSRPNIIQIELTNICNLSCKHCYRHLTKQQLGYMKKDVFEKIISEFKSPVSIGLYGTGESMLHPEFFDFVEYARKRHRFSTITLTTNGTLLNETSAQKIIGLRIDKICISLDAATPETYVKTRGKDSFNQILEGIRILINAREKMHSKTPLVGVNFVILEENKKEILDFVKLTVSLGVDFIGTLRFPLPISPEGAYIDKSKTSLEGIYNQLVEAKKYIETRKLFIKESLIQNPETVFNFGDRKGFFCSAPWEYPQITWEGEVTPCCVIPFSEVYSLGNIGKSSFGEIWNNPEICAFRRKIKKSIPPINWCKKCFY